jgi:GNAT superfamily N-acetyltransferase
MEPAASATRPSTPVNRPSTPANRPPAPELLKLRDGSLVTLRAVGQDDEAPLQAFLMGLCANSLRLRFFTAGANIAGAAHWAAGTPADRYGLLAHDEAGVLVAHAVYVKLDQTRAEVAVEVADHLHDRGLGTILMQRIGAAAQERGITHFVAEVLPENRGMLDVFRDGFDAHVAFHDGIDTVEFPTSAWRLARERFSSECLVAAGQPPHSPR